MKLILISFLITLSLCEDSFRHPDRSLQVHVPTSYASLLNVPGLNSTNSYMFFNDTQDAAVQKVMTHWHQLPFAQSRISNNLTANWAYATAAASTTSWWINLEKNLKPNYLRVISPYSVQRAVLNTPGSNVSCNPGANPQPNKYLNHTAYGFSGLNRTAYRLIETNDWPGAPNVLNTCNLAYLNSFNDTGAKIYDSTIVNVVLHTTNAQRLTMIRNLMRLRGIALTSIKMDTLMATQSTSLNSYIYTPGTFVTWDTAVVIGVWNSGTTLYLAVLILGAQFPNNMYYWVDINHTSSSASLENKMLFISTYYPDLTTW